MTRIMTLIIVLDCPERFDMVRRREIAIRLCSLPVILKLLRSVSMIEIFRSVLISISSVDFGFYQSLV